MLLLLLLFFVAESTAEKVNKTTDQENQEEEIEADKWGFILFSSSNLTMYCHMHSFTERVFGTLKKELFFLRTNEFVSMLLPGLYNKSVCSCCLPFLNKSCILY